MPLPTNLVSPGTSGRLMAVGCLFFAMSSFAAEVRVLTGDPGTSQTGQWNVASGASQRLDGLPGLYAASGSGATYTFTPNLPETTDYSVEVFNNCYTPRAHNATHVIRHAAGTTTHTLEQDCALDPYVGQWRPLGTYQFNAGTEGAVTIDTTDSGNVYVGATGVRFVYTPAAGEENSVPVITPSATTISVTEGEQVSLTASAVDEEDGDLTPSIIWTSPQGNGEGGSFLANAGTTSFFVDVSVMDSEGAIANTLIQVDVVPPEQPPQESQFYGFDCDNFAVPEPLAGFTTNNASALPAVGTRCGTYVADLLNNDDNITLHFNQQQGRLDGVQVSFPFVAIARGVGIAPIGEPTQAHSVPGAAYVFAGLQVHHADLENRNSAHVVVGQRGNTRNTIEGKQTLDGVSEQDDIGNEALPTGRADIRIVGNADRTLTVYWQPHMPGTPDQWIAYEAPGSGRTPGDLRGSAPDWGDTVYVGLITYAYGSAGVPFTGVADSLEIIQE